ncbi:MAG: metal-dependent hydrolase [Haloarculaceae archaeon]
MASTLVHVAFAGLLAAALLGPYFDRRAVLVVFAVTAFPDLDSFVALVSVAGHRTVFHTFLIPIGLGALLAVDTRLRSRSFVRERWGAWGVHVGWVSVVALAVAGIGLDFVGAGVNPLWPLHDQFYVLDGKIELSDQRGVIQTFIDLTPEAASNGGGSGGGGSGGGGGSIPAPESLGSSQEVNMTTGIEPDPTNTKKNPERIFPVVRSGWQLLLLVVGFAVTGARLRLSGRQD